MYRATPNHGVRVAQRGLQLYRDDNTVTAFTIGLPEDMRWEDLPAMLEAFGGFVREWMDRDKPKGNGLVIAKGPLPKI